MKSVHALLLTLLLSCSAVFAVDKVNINTADAETLAGMIDGVGEKKAAAIILYREENGPFEMVEDLVNVKGISDGILEKNREHLSVE